MFKLFNRKKANCSLDWPKEAAAGNQPNFSYDADHKLHFDKLSATVIYDPDKFTDSQRVFLLSMLNPAQDHVYFLPLATPTAQALLSKMSLSESAHLIFASQSRLQIQPLFMPDQRVSELNYLFIEEVACIISGKRTAASLQSALS